MVRRRKQRSKHLASGVFGFCTAVVVCAVSTGAHAQTSSYQSATDNVTINWGALDGTAATAPSARSYGAQAPRRSGGLLVPGAEMPRSQLHVPAPSGGNVQLRNPSGYASAPPAANPQPSAPKAAPAPRVAEAPAPKPAPAPEPAPTPAPAAPAKLTQAPPPPPPSTETASAAPPPPPVPSAPAPAAPPMPKQETPATTAPGAPEPTEQASKPDAATATGGPSQVLFNGDDTKLSADAQGVLETVVAKMASSDGLRVQLLAYAAGEDLTSSKARRISLSRALSVRSYLIEKGVRSTRIDVRALGDKADSDPKNRVDVNLIER